MASFDAIFFFIVLNGFVTMSSQGFLSSILMTIDFESQEHNVNFYNLARIWIRPHCCCPLSLRGGLFGECSDGPAEGVLQRRMAKEEQ